MSMMSEYDNRHLEATEILTLGEVNPWELLANAIENNGEIDKDAEALEMLGQIGRMYGLDVNRFI